MKPSGVRTWKHKKEFAPQALSAFSLQAVYLYHSLEEILETRHRVSSPTGPSKLPGLPRVYRYLPYQMELRSVLAPARCSSTVVETFQMPSRELGTDRHLAN